MCYWFFYIDLNRISQVFKMFRKWHIVNTTIKYWIWPKNTHTHAVGLAFAVIASKFVRIFVFTLLFLLEFHSFAIWSFGDLCWNNNLMKKYILWVSGMVTTTTTTTTAVDGRVATQLECDIQTHHLIFVSKITIIITNSNAINSIVMALAIGRRRWNFSMRIHSSTYTYMLRMCLCELTLLCILYIVYNLCICMWSSENIAEIG